MALDPSYLVYPHRHPGMDHDYYPWSSIFDRPPVSWPAGRPLAVTVMISLEWFPIVPADQPFRAPGHMQTPYPDYRHYTARDYGNRVGIYRLLDLFERHGIRAGIATNAAIASRYPALIKDILAGGHEIIAHSTDMNGTIASTLAEADEEALIETSLDTLERATGKRPEGWYSIDHSQSFQTPRLLAKHGVRYMCDWVNDDLPYRFHTPAGDLVNVPINHELSDRQILTVQQQTIDSYAEQMLDAADWLEGEARRYGGRLLPMHLTPYIIALPYRMDRFDRLIAELAARPAVGFLTPGEVAGVVAVDG